MKKIYSFIFARGGSKGLPNKNIKKLVNKTLLEHSIGIAKSTPRVSKVFVSSESKKILELAHQYGAEFIPRPVELADDESPEWLAWQHAVKWVESRFGKFDIFLSLPCTSPLRIVDDVDNCLDALDNDSEMIITMTEANRSPWFNMVSRNDKGNLDLVCANNDIYTRRQDTPTCFDLTTVAYVSRPRYVLNNESMWAGNVGGIEIPAERGVDIDTILDFKYAELLLKEQSIQNSSGN